MPVGRDLVPKSWPPNGLLSFRHHGTKITEFSKLVH